MSDRKTPRDRALECGGIFPVKRLEREGLVIVDASALQLLLGAAKEVALEQPGRVSEVLARRPRLRAAVEAFLDLHGENADGSEALAASGKGGS